MVMPVILFANVFISSFSNLLVPEFSRLLTCKNYKRLQFVCNVIFKVTFIFSIGITFMFFLFSNDISLIVYQSIEPGKWIKILSPLIFFIYIDNIIDNMLKGINEQVSVMFCNILDLLTTISIIFFIVPIYGMYGYIFSIFVSELLNFTISILQLKKRIKYHINVTDFIVFPILSCVFSCCLIIVFKMFFINNFLLLIFLFILTYIFFLHLFKCFKFFYMRERPKSSKF